VRDSHCQAYSGLAQQCRATNMGVDATRGEVVARAGGLVEAVYCDTCGGRTESIENVWSTDANPSLVATEDRPGRGPFLSLPPTEDLVTRWLHSNPPAFCRDGATGQNPMYRWTVEMSGPTLDAAVNAAYNVGRVRALEPLERGLSGRIKLLRVVGEKGQVLIQKEGPIRKALGNLRSALFVVEARPGPDGTSRSWRFHGAGWGHGVGLCQTGARAAARAGFGYREILAHYFRGTTVARAYL